VSQVGSRITGKPEVIRVRRPIVRNRDCLSPLACVVGLPDKWFWDISNCPVSALGRSRPAADATHE
jgi:hypothetical protein